MPRGGRRSGTPGVAHWNRSDLNTPTSGGQYGDRAATQARLDAVPITPPAPPPMAQQPLQAPPPLDRPTDRPMEPITSGLPTGPGPGPEAIVPSTDPVAETLRVMYQAFPNEAIGALLESYQGKG